MSLKSQLTRQDEESRYLSLINALMELDHEFRALDLPGDARVMLTTLIEVSRSDFRRRFRRE